MVHRYFNNAVNGSLDGRPLEILVGRRPRRKPLSEAAIGWIALGAISLLYATLICQWLLTIGDLPAKPAFETLTLLLAFLIGSALGSLDNVFIYRLPRHMPLLRPRRSICSSCNTRLTTLDIFPMLSFLLIRGKCRYCKQPIPVRYLTVELIQGVMWAAIAYLFLILRWMPLSAAALIVIASAALIAWFIRQEKKTIKNEKAALRLAA